MSVSRTPKGKWRAEVRHQGCHYHLGIFGSEAAARAATEAEYAAVRAGTSEICRFPGTMPMRDFAERIQVKAGTIKRWIHEGMPVVRGAAFVRIDPTEAEKWIAAHYPNTVAFRRKSVIYFVQRESDNAIKIGFSSDVLRRVGEIRKDHQAACALLAVIPGDKPREAEMHARFAALRVEDEWFRPDAELVQFIESLGREAA